MKLPQRTMRGLLAGALFHELATEAAAAHKIGPNAMLVLLAIEELHYKGRLSPSVDLVELQLGLSTSAVRLAIGQLHRADLLTKNGVGKAATVMTTEAGFNVLTELSAKCWGEVAKRLKRINVWRKDVLIFAQE
jgi:predicted MarR family transcription regulator